MKKSWKMLLSLCLILALLLSLCACGDDEAADVVAPAQAASEPTAGLMTVYVPAQVATPEPTAAPMITPEPTATPEPAPKTAAGTGVCGDYEYEYYTDGTACITRYSDRETVVVIPSELDGYPVTAIGDLAFDDRSVKSVTIPDSVIEMGANPFMDCNFLTQIIVSASHPALEVIDGVLFDKNEKRLITYSCAFTAKEYAIPQGIEEIGDYAFYFCESLTAVTIPDSVTAIGNGAFFGCGSLTPVTIPDSVTVIGDRAFHGCTSLTAVTIPDSVTEIGANPFSFCFELVEINVSPEHPTLAVIDGVLFEKTSKRLVTYPSAFTAAEYSIPQGIEEIDGYAFSDCTSLTAVTIPDSVTAIGDYAFCFCESLTAVTIPDSVTVIGDRAFDSCTSLTAITIPDSVTEIGANPFPYCFELVEINVSPEHPTLAVIDGVLFEKAKKRLVTYLCAFTAAEYTIPQEIKEIGDWAFYGCTSLTAVTIPEGVTSIGDYAFYGCTSLTAVTIPEGVTSIGDYAFYYCSSLTCVTIPDSVTAIGDKAFGDCGSLTAVTIPSSVTAIGDRAFAGCPNLTLTITRDSYAAQYCKDNGLKYRYTDADD